jgi:hypothetical protein
VIVSRPFHRHPPPNILSLARLDVDHFLDHEWDPMSSTNLQTSLNGARLPRHGMIMTFTTITTRFRGASG